MRTQNPLIAASRPIILEPSGSADSIALLCRRYRDRVLRAHLGNEQHVQQRLRTWLRPALLRDAASRIILAQLPTRIIARIYDERPAEFADNRLCHTLDEVKDTLAQIRQCE